MLLQTWWERSKREMRLDYADTDNVSLIEVDNF